MQQLNSDIFFQQMNLRAERWLGQVKTFGFLLRPLTRNYGGQASLYREGQCV
jgi:hypothetical protein